MATRTAGGTFEATSFAWAQGTFTVTGTWSDAEGRGAVALLATVDGRRRMIEAQGGRIAEDGPKWGARFRSDAPPDAGTLVALVLAGEEFPLPEPQVREPDARRFARTAALPPPPPPPAPPSTVAPQPAAAEEPLTAPQPADPAPTAGKAGPLAAPQPADPAPAADAGAAGLPATAAAADPLTAPQSSAGAAEPVPAGLAPSDDPGSIGSNEVQELRQLLVDLRQERQAVEAATRRLAQERAAAEKVATGLPKRAPLPPRKPRSTETAGDVDYTPAYWVAAFALLLFFIVLIWIF